MKVEQFASNCYQINLGMVNCFLIESDGLTLIDTGYPKDKSKLYKALSEIGKQTKDVKQIIVTHLHPDHAGNAAQLQQEWKVPVFAHNLDANLLKQGICIRKTYQVTKGAMNRILFWSVSAIAPKKISPIQALIEVNDGDILPISSGLKVIHTPGHSSGHISLLLMKEKILFVADAAVNGFGLQLAPLYENQSEGKESLKKIVNYDFDVAFFGHGNPILQNAKHSFEKLYSKI